MKITSWNPHFAGIYRFQSMPAQGKNLRHSLSDTTQRDQLFLKMKKQDPAAYANVLLPYQGQVLGVSGQDAMDLKEVCSDVYIDRLYSIAKRLPGTVFNPPARPFSEETVTQFLASKGKTLETLKVIEA